MNVKAILDSMPIGRWSEITTSEGRTDVYRCDTSAAGEDIFLIERPGIGGRKHRFTMNQAVKFFNHLLRYS